MKLTPSQLGTTLAALRYYQLELKLGNRIPDQFLTIAENDGECFPLTPDQIGALCEELNISSDIQP